MQLTMSTEVAGFWPPISEVADVEKEDHSPESFDKEIEDLFRDWTCPQVQDTFSYYHDTFSVISTPSSLTLSTESDSESTLSQYSCSFASSDYSTSSDIVTGGPAEQGIYSPHGSIYSDVISNGPLSFGSLPPSQPPNPVKVHSNYGTSNGYQPFFDISPEDPSFTPQEFAVVIPPTPCVQVTPDTQAYATPDRPFQCPLCPFASKRKYNLKTHFSTHDKETPKPFRCTTCSRRFGRKNDLKRHQDTMHGDLNSSSSTYSDSAASPGPTIDFPADFSAYFRGV